MIDLLRPGATIGILGGGQLGRMLALAAARLGMRTHIFCPDPESPALEVTPHHTIAAYDDEAALSAFAAGVDVVTYEFENVPAGAAALLAGYRPLRPGPEALRVSQDRLAEKSFLSANGIPVAPYRAVAAMEDLVDAVAALGTPSVLKTTRLGYDGKGQRMLHSAADALEAFEDLSPKPLVLEAFVRFEREISIVAARGLDGSTAFFDPAENRHENHILRSSTVPANIWPATAIEARHIAGRILGALDYVGVLGVEFFVLASGKVVVNEIAPRVHNSGHWTDGACTTDQFEQHIRAIAGWPLGDPSRFADAVMDNLLGNEIDALPARLGPNQRFQIYGKTDARPGRKMGHVTTIRPENGGQ